MKFKTTDIIGIIIENGKYVGWSWSHNIEVFKTACTEADFFNQKHEYANNTTEKYHYYH